MPESGYRSELRRRLLALPKEQLAGMLEDAAKNWLAHDGLWFQAVEGRCGMGRLDIAPSGGLDALERALGRRLYAYLNVQEAVRTNERTLVFRMNDCRVQAARKRKGLPDFPCRPVGEVEYSNFARTCSDSRSGSSGKHAEAGMERVEVPRPPGGEETRQSHARRTARRAARASADLAHHDDRA